MPRLEAVGASAARWIGGPPFDACFFFGSGLVGVTVHGLQYIGSVIATERRRSITGDSNWAQIFLAIYWGLFCHHFWLDQKIWRPSLDSRLRKEPGLGAA